MIEQSSPKKVAKELTYNGVPLLAATIVVKADGMNVTVHADPSMGKYIYLEKRVKDGLTRKQAIDLAQRLTQATAIMDELAIKDAPGIEGLGDLPERLTRLCEIDDAIEQEIQVTFDAMVHDLTSLQGSTINNCGMEEQLGFLVDQLGIEEMSNLLDRVEADFSARHELPR